MTELAAFDQNYTGVVAGVDEAGRGPWAGPVVAASVIIPAGVALTGVNDSKKISAAKRETLFEEIMAVCDVGVGVIAPEVIDTINILEATKQGMQRAVAGLSSVPDTVLVDGNQPPQLPMPTVAVIKGDQQSLSIAAASIIAKVTRDRIMAELHTQFPHYGWDRNAGYGTAQHQEAIAAHGITVHHRKSFAPIRRYLMEHTEMVS